MNDRDERELLRMWNITWERSRGYIRQGEAPVDVKKRYLADQMENAVEIGLCHDVFAGVDRYEARRYMQGRRRRTANDPSPVRVDCEWIVTQQPMSRGSDHVIRILIYCSMLHRQGPWVITQNWTDSDVTSSDYAAYGYDPGMFDSLTNATGTTPLEGNLTVARVAEAQRAMQDIMTREAARLYGLPTQMLDQPRRRNPEYDAFRARPLPRGRMEDIPPPRPGDRQAREQYRERAIRNVMVYMDPFEHKVPPKQERAYHAWGDELAPKSTWVRDPKSPGDMVCTAHGCVFSATMGVCAACREEERTRRCHTHNATWDPRYAKGCVHCIGAAVGIEALERLIVGVGNALSLALAASLSLRPVAAIQLKSHTRVVCTRHGQHVGIRGVLSDCGPCHDHLHRLKASVTLLSNLILTCGNVLWESTDDMTKRFVLAADERERVSIENNGHMSDIVPIEFETVPPDAYYDNELRRIEERRAAKLCIAICATGYCMLAENHEGEHRAPDEVDPAKGVDKLLLEMS